MTLTDHEKEEITAMIDAGQKLPPRYRAALFEQPQEVELIWPGKTNEVTNVVLPFQSIEQIDEPCAGSAAGNEDLFALDQQGGRQTGGWTNKLIWRDNQLVLASLKNGPPRREIEDAGGLKLVYIDPPFDVGADFSLDVEIGEERVTKEPGPIERLNGEIKRRTDVVGIFPIEAAVTRLIGAILLEQNDEWAVQRARSMTLQTIAPLSDNPLVSLPAVAA